MDPSLIYDVGLNNGDDTAYYLHLGYRVVAVDADPTHIERARARFARQIAAGQLILVNAGIASEESRAPFWVTEGNDVLSSFSKELATRYGYSARPIEIECCRFSKLLGQYGVPYYLKIDIEGNDRLCLADIDPRDPPPYLSLEINHGLDELVLLRRLGYNRFKLVGQNPHAAIHPAQGLSGWHTGLVERWKAKIERNRRRWRERLARWGLVQPFSPEDDQVKGAGRDSSAVAIGASPPLPCVDGQWRFPPGSSGPFGEKAPGRWLTCEEAVVVLFHHLCANRGDLWCDLHARHRRHRPAKHQARDAA